MAEPKRGQSIEKELMDALKYGGIDKANLAELVRIVVDFNAKGIRPYKVFPRGIPVPDGVTVQTLLDAKALQTLVGELGSNPRIRGVEVFPLGIPFPEIFRTEIGIE